MWQKTKKVVYWALFLIVGSIAGVIGKEIGGELIKPNKQEALSKVVTEAASRINAQAPKKLDEVTTLVRAEAVGGNKLVTFYTLKDFDSYASDFSFSRLKSAISKQVCGKQKSKDQSALSMGMSHVYVYTRESGAEIARLEITIKDCM